MLRKVNVNYTIYSIASYSPQEISLFLRAILRNQTLDKFIDGWTPSRYNVKLCLSLILICWIFVFLTLLWLRSKQKFGDEESSLVLSWRFLFVGHVHLFYQTIVLWNKLIRVFVALFFVIFKYRTYRNVKSHVPIQIRLCYPVVQWGNLSYHATNSDRHTSSFPAYTIIWFVALQCLQLAFPDQILCCRIVSREWVF